jgi:hypothetical protein
MTRGEKPLAFIASDFKVVTCEDHNTPKLFSTLTPWQLLNLTSAVILDIPDKLLDQYGITSECLASALSPYLTQTAGKDSASTKSGPCTLSSRSSAPRRKALLEMACHAPP